MTTVASPPPHVLAAFNIHGVAQPILEGQGTSFRVDHYVLKPVENVVETDWLCELQTRMSQARPLGYRVASPVVVGGSGPKSFVCAGWSATQWLDGKTGSKGRWQELFTASRAFHADLNKLVTQPPDFLSKRRHRWAEADRVAWDEKALDDVEAVNFDVLEILQPHLNRLSQLKRPIQLGSTQPQLIHGDLTGNVLFGDPAQHLPPAIIDISPYWRPVAYAEAVVVADGLSFHSETGYLVELYGTDEFRLQILIRALYFRILTFTMQSDLVWIQQTLPKTTFDNAIDVVTRFVKGGPNAGVNIDSTRGSEDL